MIAPFILSPIAKIFSFFGGKSGVYLLFAVAVGFAGYHYRQTVYEEGYRDCQRERQAEALKVQAQTEKKIEAALIEAKHQWQTWHQKELSRIQAVKETEVVYETIIKQVPRVATQSTCTVVGLESLQLFNDAIRATHQRTGGN